MEYNKGWLGSLLSHIWQQQRWLKLPITSYIINTYKAFQTVFCGCHYRQINRINYSALTFLADFIHCNVSYQELVYIKQGDKMLPLLLKNWLLGSFHSNLLWLLWLILFFDLQDGIDGVGDGRDVGISVPVAMIMNTIQVSIMTRGE